MDLSAPGNWDVQTAVRRQGRPDTLVRAIWTVPGGPLGGRQPVITDRPWSAALDGLALGLAVVLAAGAMATRRRRRHSLAACAEQEPAAAPHPELAGV